MNFEPLLDRVLVRRDESEKRSTIIFLLPDKTEKATTGEVLAVGPGYRGEDGIYRPTDIKVGEHVVFSRGYGQAVTIDGEELLLLREVDVIGRFKQS